MWNKSTWRKAFCHQDSEVFTKYPLQLPTKSSNSTVALFSQSNTFGVATNFLKIAKKHNNNNWFANFTKSSIIFIKHIIPTKSHLPKPCNVSPFPPSGVASASSQPWPCAAPCLVAVAMQMWLELGVIRAQHPRCKPMAGAVSGGFYGGFNDLFRGFLGFNQFCGGILWHFVGIIEFCRGINDLKLIQINGDFQGFSLIVQCLGWNHIMTPRFWVRLSHKHQVCFFFIEGV